MLPERPGERVRWLACALALSLCLALPALAQEAAKAPLVGVLLINTAANPEPAVPLFRDALAGLGYVEGRNLRLDFRFAEGHAERFPALAEALVGDKPAVILALGDPATRAHNRRRARSRSSRSPTIWLSPG